MEHAPKQKQCQKLPPKRQQLIIAISSILGTTQSRRRSQPSSQQSILRILAVIPQGEQGQPIMDLSSFWDLGLDLGLSFWDIHFELPADSLRILWDSFFCLYSAKDAKTRSISRLPIRGNNSSDQAAQITYRKCRIADTIVNTTGVREHLHFKACEALCHLFAVIAYTIIYVCQEVHDPHFPINLHLLQCQEWGKPYAGPYSPRWEGEHSHMDDIGPRVM